MFPAEFYKMPKISLPGQIELAFNLFVMNPENVGGNNLHSARLHFQNFFFPVRFGVTSKVELTHHGQPRLGIFQHIAAVDGERLPGFRDAIQMEVTSFRRRDGPLRVNRNNRVAGLLEAERQDCKRRKERQARRREYRLLELFHSSEIEWSRGLKICSPPVERPRSAGLIDGRRAKRAAPLRLPVRSRACPQNAWAAPGVGRDCPAGG